MAASVSGRASRRLGLSKPEAVQTCREEAFSFRVDDDALGDPSVDPRARWYVLHTKARQEKALADDLRARGIDFFLPLVHVARYYGRRKSHVHVALFPSYLFLYGGLDQTYLADRTDRVAGVITVRDQGKLRAELSNIRAAIAAGAPLTPADGIKDGMLAEVTSGPFRGIRGTAESGFRSDRLFLQVDLIGKGSILEIDRTLLRAVE